MIAVRLLCVLPVVLGNSIMLTEIEAATMMEQFDVIVDVRGEASYINSHVQGAVLQSRTSLEGCEDKKVAFYCSVGSASLAQANLYAVQSNSQMSYAIGTLDNLASAGVATESGMPISHDPQCLTPEERAAREKAAREKRLIMILIPVGVIVSLLLACLAYRFACRTTPKVKEAVDEERAAAAKKLPPQVA